MNFAAVAEDAWKLWMDANTKEQNAEAEMCHWHQIQPSRQELPEHRLSVNDNWSQLSTRLKANYID